MRRSTIAQEKFRLITVANTLLPPVATVVIAINGLPSPPGKLHFQHCLEC